MSVRDAIERKLTEALSPQHLDVIDDSARHAGHAGANAAGESHFKVLVVSAAFEGQNRVQRQRLVYDALADELAGPIHALELKTLTPAEAA